MAQPTAFEQYMLELLNRARSDPAGEAARLGIELNQGLAAGTITATPKAPLAFNERLIDAARAHSDWMFAADTFSHTGVNGSSPGDRMAAAGYSFTGSWTWGENIATQYGSRLSITQSVTAGLEEGLFRSPGHRTNILGEGFREIGIGITGGEYQGFQGVMATQNFARSGSSRFLTGVAFGDRDGDRFYDVGEGRGGIAVEARAASGAVYTTTTWDAGGYQMALPSGSYTVTFSGGGLAAPVVRSASVGTVNTKLDLETLSASAPQPSTAAELLLRRTSGDIVAWDASRGPEGFTGLATFGAATPVRMLADLDADGRDDLLLGTGGSSHVWWDVSAGPGGFHVLPDFGPFQAVAAGDFTGSAAEDLLLRAGDGRLVFLDAAGGNRVDAFLTLASRIAFVGTGNLDGTGRDDVLFQDTVTGGLFHWNGTGFTDLLRLGTGWQVGGIGDFTGGEADDLLLVNGQTGAALFWETARGASGFRNAPAVGAGFAVTGAADLDGDGKDDVLQQNTATGDGLYWNGTRFVGLGDVLSQVSLVGLGDVA